MRVPLSFFCRVAFKHRLTAISAGLLGLLLFMTALSPAGLAQTLAAAPATAPATSPAASAPDATPAADAQVAPVATAAPAPNGKEPTIAPIRPATVLLPFIRSLADPGGGMTVAQVAAPEKEGDFQPFDPQNLPRQAGSMWLRFRLGPLPAAERAAGNTSGQEYAQLDLGDQVPGTPRVWIKPSRSSEPQAIAPSQPGLYPLVGLSGGGEVFVQMDGLPGLWFTPTLRPFSDAVVALEKRVHSLTLAALTVLLMLCLVRSITERGDGRIWAGIFAGAALIQAAWGVPATPLGTVLPLDMPGILAAALALMLLPHVGRIIMRTRETSPAVDILLLILAVPGVALALVPLLPGSPMPILSMLPSMAWTARLMSVWPLGAVLSLVPALVLLRRQVPGSGLFALACLGMTLSCVLALWGASGPFPSPLWGQGPLLGVTFATLLLAAAAPRSAYAEPEPTYVTDEPSTSSAMHGLQLTHVGNDTSAATADLPSSLRLEEALRGPLDALLREACSLDQALDRPAEVLSAHDTQQAKRHADNLVAASRELSALVTNIPRTALGAAPTSGTRQIFDLYKLVQSAFTAVKRDAELKDLGLAWYVAPHLGKLYKGDRDRLRFILIMLLSDAVRATRRGVVSLRVRRADMSPNPGHLQFTVADTGDGTPPLRRSSMMLARAWELAADHQGDLFVDSTPRGAEITFSLDCTALADDAESQLPVPPAEINAREQPRPLNPRLMIIASPVPLNRQMLAYYLDNQGQEIWEARDAEEAVALYTHTPAALVLLDGHLPEDDIVTAIAAIRVFEGEQGLSSVPFLALSLNEAQAERLHQAGCDHSLPQPVVRGELRAMALHLASPSGARPRPAIVPHRLAPTRLVRHLTADTTFFTTTVPPTETAGTAEAARPELPITPMPDAPAEAVPTPQASSALSQATPLAEQNPEPTDELQEALAEPLQDLPNPPDQPDFTAESDLLPVFLPVTAQDDALLPPAMVEDPVVVDSEVEPEPQLSFLPLAENNPEIESGAGAVALPEPSAPLDSIPAPEATAQIAVDCEVPPLPDVTAQTVEPATPLRHVAAEKTPVAPAPGLHIPPAPKQRLGWLSKIFKPTPNLAGSNEVDDVPRLGSEWVGEPTPMTGGEGSSVVSSIPAPQKEQAQAETRHSAGLTLDESSSSWFSPYSDDSGSSVGEPQPQVQPANVAPQAPVVEPSAAVAATMPRPLDFDDASPPKTAPTHEKPVMGRAVPDPSKPPHKNKSKKRRVQDLPFLSLDPNYLPAQAARSSSRPVDPALTLTDDRTATAPAPHALSLFDVSSKRPFERTDSTDVNAPLLDDEVDDIMDLTEAEVLESPLLQQVPDLLRSLDAALEHAATALANEDAWGLDSAASRMADRAVAFGLHALSDLALCMGEAAKNRDFETVAQLLPELRTEVARNRH